MIELERTYLLRKIPEGLESCKSKEIIDVYIPRTSEHPKLRIRKNDVKFEMTKKQPLTEDKSSHEEQTIILNEQEFNELVKIEGKKVHKLRYYYNYNNKIFEIDVFQGPLKGLILVDIEFNTEEKRSFKIPDFCLAEVTKEEFLAGGMLCGKSYKDIEEKLKSLII